MDPLLAGGDSWKWQLRDSKGRWIEMGSKVKWMAKGAMKSGEVVGSPKPGVATVEEDKTDIRSNVAASRLTVYDMGDYVRGQAKKATADDDVRAHNAKMDDALAAAKRKVKSLEAEYRRNPTRENAQALSRALRDKETSDAKRMTDPKNYPDKWEKVKKTIPRTKVADTSSWKATPASKDAYAEWRKMERSDSGDLSIPDWVPSGGRPTGVSDDAAATVEGMKETIANLRKAGLKKHADHLAKILAGRSLTAAGCKKRKKKPAAVTAASSARMARKILLRELE